MQADDFKWFVEHYDELFEKYGMSYLAIKDRSVLGSFDSPKAAISAVSKEYPLGSFIIQLCNGNESGYTNYFANSHVIAI